MDFLDPDDVNDALASAVGEDMPRPGVWPQPATASPRRVNLFRAQVRRFLEDVPGDTSVSELREALDPVREEPL